MSNIKDVKLPYITEKFVNILKYIEKMYGITAEEKKHYKQLNSNKRTLSEEQRAYYNELSDKVSLNKLHKELLEFCHSPAIFGKYYSHVF